MWGLCCNRRHANRTLVPTNSQQKALPGIRPSFSAYRSHCIGMGNMPNRRYDHYENNGRHHLVMQILESNAIQDLIKAISGFFRHRARGKDARGKKAKGKKPRDEREDRHHRKDQRRRESPRHRPYDDGDRYGGGTEPRRGGKRGRNSSHDGPAHVLIIRISKLTM